MKTKELDVRVIGYSIARSVMTLKFMGIKKGMTRIYGKDGKLVVCTVISVEPNIVSQVKRQDRDGYNAIQLSAVKTPSSKLRNVTKPLQGHFKKAGIEPMRYLAESRIENLDEYQVGQAIDLSYFSEDEEVDCQGKSKGKGFAGSMKRHNFSGGPASHGSGFHRHAGSDGMRSSPGRCLPGKKKAGRMGHEVVSVQNLKVAAIDMDHHLLLVAGAVPGARGGLIYITKAVKKQGKSTR
jgi:large subunit ribosomal protein L3